MSACGAKGPSGNPCIGWGTAGPCVDGGAHVDGRGNTWPVSLAKWLGTAEDLAMLAEQAVLAAEVSAEADRIEADYTKPHDPPWDPLDVASAWHGCNSALDDAATSLGAPEQHRYLVRLAAWAMVALRAEARERAALVGATGATGPGPSEATPESAVAAPSAGMQRMAAEMLHEMGEPTTADLMRETAAKGGGHG